MRLLLSICLLVLPVTAAAQDPLESRVGVYVDASPSEIRGFLEKLQRSLATGDRHAACGLLQYPRPAGNLKDVADCEERFHVAFDAEVIDATLAQRYENLFVGPGGIAVGAGELWIEDCLGDCDLRVTRTVTRNERLAFASNAEKSGRVFLDCRTADDRIEVASNGESGVQFRSWAAGRAISSPPQTAIVRGISTGEGHGACAYSIWSFPRTDGRIDVEQIGCYESSHAPPDNAVAQVVTRQSNRSEKSEYCFRPR